jgi:hypothetical protein
MPPLLDNDDLVALGKHARKEHLRDGTDIAYNCRDRRLVVSKSLCVLKICWVEILVGET